MGKGRGRGGGNKGGRGRGRGRGGRGGGQGYRAEKHTVEKKNQLLEKYYNSQLSFENEEERESFWTALKRELPNSFRFTGSKGHALAVQEKLVKHYIPQITEIEFEGEKVSPPEAISWFPDQLAWQMTTPKNVIRRFAPFKAFQQFLVSETSVGNISRQEIVSMIPPLLLDVQPGQTVLDLCAAPGSKSAQLIEAVHSGEEARMRKVAKDLEKEQGRPVSADGETTDIEMRDAVLMQDSLDDGRATGLLVANDVDYRRAHMLIHQMKRLNSPNLIVTNHDATLFPSIKLPTEEGAPNRYLKFDRILADVPCSGDGTARKNPNVWKDWTPGNGLGLHATQVKILVRSLQMLKVGGRVVYSTCSMNPVENEAVVSAAIDRCGGMEKVDILDGASILPGLKHKPGKKTWQIMDKMGRMWSSLDEVEQHKSTNGEEGLGKLYPGMFPISDDYPMERCVRVEPHQQDTGGFFITVLEKKSEIKARQEPSIRTATVIRQEAGAKDMTTDPQKPVPSIIAVVDEIAQRDQSNGGLDKIEALDKIAPPTIPHDEVTNSSAVARMNQGPNIPNATTKRPAEDPAEEDVPIKKMKTNDDADAAAATAVAEGQRSVHYPPPPATQETKDLASAEQATLQAAKDQPAEAAKGKKASQQHFEEPFKYLNEQQKDLNTIFGHYSINSRFPRDRFMVRNATGEPARTIYYTSSLAKDILTENEGKGMKFVHCGIKMFVKQDVQREDQCPWRIQTDGLQLLDSWVAEERIVRLTSRNTLFKLLKEMFPKVAGGSWQDLNEIGERVRDMELGCSVLRVETGEGEDAFTERMVLPLWRSLYSLNLMLPKEDRKAMLLRLYNDNGELIDHQQLKKAEEQAASEDSKRPSAPDDPAPGETHLVNQRAADIEEISAEFGAPDDDEDDDMDEEGGVRLDLNGGVALEPDAAQQEAKLKLREEALGVREGGVGTEDNEDIRDATEKEV